MLNFQQFTQILSEHLTRWWNLGQAIMDCYKIATWLLIPDFFIKQSRIVTRLLLDCLTPILSSSNQGLLQDYNNSQIQFHLCPKMDAWIIPCKTRKSCHFKADLGFGLRNPKLTHFGFQKQRVNNQNQEFQQQKGRIQTKTLKNHTKLCEKQKL